MEVLLNASFLVMINNGINKILNARYTSIGSIHDTVPNGALYVETRQNEGIKHIFRPAYMLRDGRLERAGRSKRKQSNKVENERDPENIPCANSLFAASILVVGDEILYVFFCLFLS